jgi:hypothetical protein
MLAVLDEPLVTLEQLPVWVDSMSNKSAEITALANDALNREIERQGSTFAVEQSKCLELLDQITGDARARRLQIELQHAIEKDLRNVAQLQEEISSRRSAELKSMSDAMVQMQAQQTLCWKKWSAQVFNTSFNFEASFKAKISANYRELNANFDSVNAKLDGFKTQYDSFVVRSKAMAIKAKGLYDGFKSFIGYVDDVDFLNLASLPRPSAPPLFEAGPDWNFVPLSTKPLGDWLVDLKMPECPCDGAPPPPPPFMENNTQAARNYTAFAPAKEKQEKKSASAVPIPSVSLRSFVSLPVLIDLFGWLPDFGWLAGLLVIVDILLIVFTHIRTIQGVAALVRGHIEEDEIVRDYNVGARVVRACGCGWGAALIACVLRCVDVCEVAMRKHRRILVTAVSVTFNALLGMTAVALFALGMYILAEVASAVLTIQALDGLGIISAIVAPVTSALGTANVKAIENARVINTQTLLAAENAYNQALFELAQTTNDFNDDQERDLAAFNDEYCQLYATLATYDKRPTECVNPVRQIPAVVVLEECPYWLEVVPRLYADVDRTQYRDLVVTTLEPFVVAARTIVLDCIWFVAYVVIGVAVMFILSTALYYLLVLVHMIRVRKRVIFDSDRALKSKYTTRKDADGVPLKDKENSTRLRFGRPRRRAETEMETARFEGEEESDSALPGNRIKSGDHTEAVMQKLPSKFGPLPDSDFDALSKPGARHTVHIVPSAPAPTESILPPPPGSFGRSRSRSRRSSSRRSRRSARRATMPPSSAAALNNDIYASVSSAGVQPPYVSAARAPPASAASPAPPPNVQQLPKFGATSALPPPIAHDDDDDDDDETSRRHRCARLQTSMAPRHACRTEAISRHHHHHQTCKEL